VLSRPSQDVSGLLATAAELLRRLPRRRRAAQDRKQAALAEA
jgi:hypothetical protein